MRPIPPQPNVARPGAVIALLAIGTFGGLSPVSAQSDPVHVHIEFIVDRYFEMPEGRGILPVAVDEAAIALENAELAAGDSVTLGEIRRYAGYVLHAVDPDIVRTGPGLGYGLRPATAGVLREIQLAVGYDSISENVAVHARHVEDAATNVLAWAEEAVRLADQTRGATDLASGRAFAQRLLRVVRDIARGVDGNQDGLRGWPDGDEGLAQAAAHMTLMKRGEGIGR